MNFLVLSLALVSLFAMGMAAPSAAPVEIEARCLGGGQACQAGSQCCSGLCPIGNNGRTGFCS